MSDGVIEREDVRLRASDEGPVLKIGETEILLQIFYDYHHTEGAFSDYQTHVEIDIDGSWWYIDTETDGVPNLTIQPVHRSVDEEADRDD